MVNHFLTDFQNKKINKKVIVRTLWYQIDPEKVVNSRCDIMERRSLDPISVYSQVALCGFDEESAQLMFCCPAENILAKPKPSQKPRLGVCYSGKMPVSDWHVTTSRRLFAMWQSCQVTILPGKLCQVTILPGKLCQLTISGYWPSLFFFYS